MSRARVREAITEPSLVDAILSPEGFGDLSDREPAARCLTTRRDGYFITSIWLNPAASIAIVAHEAFHATFYVMERAGVTLTDSSQEAFAYYLEWLMRGILACLDGSTPPAPPVTLEASAG